MTDAPEITRPLKDVTVTVGQLAKLSLTVKEDPSNQITWIRDEKEISGHQSTKTGDLVELHIPYVTLKDGGKWTCLITNPRSGYTISSSAILHVQVPSTYRNPSFLKQLSGNLYDNGTMSLTCEVLGTPLPQLIWYRNGQVLAPGTKVSVKIEGDCYLGMFACEAVNCMGKSSIFSKVYYKDYEKLIKLLK